MKGDGHLKRYAIGSNDAGQRLDKFLQKAAPLLPSSLLYKGIRKKDIKVNQKRCQPGTILAEGDTVSVYLPDSVLEPPGEDFPFLTAPPQLDIVYEDEHILLCNKPQGLLVHEDSGNHTDTLILRIQHYLYQKRSWSPLEEHSFSPALCNRIDRNTGGIVIAAKTFEALQILNQKIKERQISKYYLCILHGVPKEREGTLKGYHLKDESTNRVRIEAHPVPGAKIALTRYRVLEERDGKSLVEAELLTGRTHQIRAQFAAMGHPLWGDAKYGNSRLNAQLGNRQALWAYRIAFDFTTPAGTLDYLAGHSFQVTAPFAEAFDRSKRRQNR